MSQKTRTVTTENMAWLQNLFIPAPAQLILICITNYYSNSGSEISNSSFLPNR